MTTGDGHSHAHHHEGEIEDGPADEPRFEPGMRVRLTQAETEKYKRRPEYAEGAEGVIERLHGPYLPPTAADEPEAEYLYSVEFRPQEIWGTDHPEPNGHVYIDVWETTIEHGSDEHPLRQDTEQQSSEHNHDQ